MTDKDFPFIHSKVNIEEYLIKNFVNYFVRILVNNTVFAICSFGCNSEFRNIQSSHVVLSSLVQYAASRSFLL